MTCPNCAADLRTHHTLISATIPPIRNGSAIIEPSCRVCGHCIEVADVVGAITPGQHVMLVSGTAGVGKSTVGQYIAHRYPYILIDGDAISRKVNHRAKVDSAFVRQEYLCHTEVMHTMLVTIGLGYHVVVAYVIQQIDFSRYTEALAKYHVSYHFRVLTPRRDTCLQRDFHRPCWTAGAENVDQWFDEFETMKQSHPELCLDTSEETVEETVAKHFHALLRQAG